MYNLILTDKTILVSEHKPTIAEVVEAIRKEVGYTSEDLNEKTCVYYMAEGSVKDYWEGSIIEIADMLYESICIDLLIQGDNYYLELKELK